MKIYYQFPCVFLFSCILFSCHKNDIPYTQDGDWAAESQLNGAARSEAVSFVIDNMAYIGTGWDGLSTRYNDFWKYDPVLNIWVQVSSMPPGTQRSSAVAFSTADGKAYVGTGYDGLHYLNDFYRFDPVTNGWTSVAPYPGSPRYEAVGFGIGYVGFV